MLVNRQKIMFAPYTTTDVGKKILQTLREIFTDYIVATVDHYIANDIQGDYDSRLFKKEVTEALKSIPDNAREWVTESLHETCACYFKDRLAEFPVAKNLKDYNETIGIICIPDNKYVISKSDHCIFIFADINLCLHAKFDLKNKTVRSIRLTPETIVLGVYDVN